MFISYTHDSKAHRARVLNLSERLRRDGFKTKIDQYENGTPKVGWHRWMLNQIDRAQYVLLVCTKTYYRRFRGLGVGGKGKGADFEGSIITQAIYDDRTRTTKFVPVLFHRDHDSFIPEPVRGHTFYLVALETGLHALGEFMLGRARVRPGPLGKPRSLSRRRSAVQPASEEEVPEVGVRLAEVERRVRSPLELPPRPPTGRLFGRQSALSDLVGRLVRGEDVCLWAPAGMGKTALAAEALHQILGAAPDRGLAGSPWPDGVVYLDFYRLKANPDRVWERLAEALAPGVPGNQRQRAIEACRGRRVLVVIEGAEEAATGTDLQHLLGVLAPENRRLVLTRNKAQDWTGRLFDLTDPLDRNDSLGLLKQLTAGRIAEPLLELLIAQLGGHPLALTWVGHQMAAAEEAPEALLRDLQDAALPRWHQPGYEDHTVPWLYERTLRHLSDDSRAILASVALLAPEPFPLSAAIAALGTNDKRRGREALRPLVRHGILRLSGSAEETWEFTHALAYDFARATNRAAPERIVSALASWTRAELETATTQSTQAGQRRSADLSKISAILRHGGALLRSVGPEGAVEPLVSYLLVEFDGALRDQGSLPLRQAASDLLVQFLDEASPSQRATAEWQRMRSRTYDILGDILSEEGDLPAALVGYREGLAMRMSLATAEPHDLGNQRQLSLSYNKVGEILSAQREDEEALCAFEAALAIATSLADADPSDLARQNDLLVSYSKVADTLSEQGDYANSLHAYQSSLAISQRLTAELPVNTAWLHDLSVLRLKVGDALAIHGDVQASLESYRAGLAIAAKLAELEPGNRGWQRNLLVSHNRLGDALSQEGDLVAALAEYLPSLAIAERLAADDPSNPALQRDLSVSLHRVGDVYAAAADPTKALVTYQRSLSIAKRLAAGDQNNLGWQLDLAVSHQRVGNALSALEQRERAGEEIQEALALSERISALDPTNAELKRNVVLLRGELARMSSEVP